LERGNFVGFPLAALPAGVYTTLTGELTHLAAMNFARLRHDDGQSGAVVRPWEARNAGVDPVLRG
jgi:hypothetical protein